MLTWEFSVLDFIQAHLRSGIGDIVMPLITHLGDSGVIWVVLALVLLIYPKTRKTGAALAVALALDVICCNLILKPFVARIRPCDINTAVQLLIPRPDDFSFPSGHTGASFAAASALYFSGSKLRFPALILAALIGFSRLYLYVHYPTDVLAGAVLVALLGWVGCTLIRLMERRFYHHDHSALFRS